MSNNYTISVVNNSPERRRFVLYQASPFGQDVKGFGSVWMQVDVNSDGGTKDLKITADYFAWAGTIEEPLSDGVTVSGGKSLSATLGTETRKGSSFTMTLQEKKVKIDVDITENSVPEAPEGTYRIITSSFEPEEGVLIGLGKKDGEGRSRPVASFNPDPSWRYDIRPLVKGVISASESQQIGQALSYDAISAFPGIIDFSAGPGEGKYEAVVTYSRTGLFTIIYP